MSEHLCVWSEFQTNCVFTLSLHFSNSLMPAKYECGTEEDWDLPGPDTLDELVRRLVFDFRLFIEECVFRGVKGDLLQYELPELFNQTYASNDSKVTKAMRIMANVYLPEEKQCTCVSSMMVDNVHVFDIELK